MNIFNLLHLLVYSCTVAFCQWVLTSSQWYQDFHCLQTINFPKAKGSWVTEDTPAKKIIEYSSPPQILMLIFVCLLGKFACIQVVP